MINLLPPETKQTYLFARRNAFLVKYVTGLGVGVFVLITAIVAGLVLIQQESNSLKESVAIQEQLLKDQKEDESIERVQDISNSLKLVVDVLEQEMLFSELLKKIGTVMPSGAVMQDLSLSSDLTGAVDLTAGARDTTSASQVQVNLRDPVNGLFERVDLVSIDCNPEDTDGYPCEAVMKAQFNGSSEFMLLSEENGAEQ